MQVQQKDNSIIIDDIKDFNAEHIFKCGQAFRWYEEDDDSFTNVAFNRVINVKSMQNSVIINNTSLNDYENIWKHYFDLERNYDDVKEFLSFDDILKTAIEYGYGIKILNQDPFETIITFIISANNQIPRIKKSIEKISDLYGSYITEDEKRKYYAFPDAYTLSKVNPEELREKTKVGFRDIRIVKASEMIAKKEIVIDDIYNMDLECARETLMKLPGVGPKVCDCILLFAFDRKESFPVDVWIKRVMEELYIKQKTPKTKIALKGREIFSNYAGFANQYLFYYGREHSLGK